MHFIYIDESWDSQLWTLSALAIPCDEWYEILHSVREYRQGLYKSDGIFITKEFHATEFVAGRGRIADHVIPKGRRCQIFHETLEMIVDLPGVRLFNAVCVRHRYDWAFERILNRINRSLTHWDSHGMLICDRGQEVLYTKLVRKMRIYNPIPSKYGVWQETGDTWVNRPLDRVLEDPVFKDSKQSYFIQLADFAAYALLRREHPIPSKNKYNLHKAFDLLSPILVTEAVKNDPEGIIRIIK